MISYNTPVSEVNTPAQGVVYQQQVVTDPNAQVVYQQQPVYDPNAMVMQQQVQQQPVVYANQITTQQQVVSYEMNPQGVVNPNAQVVYQQQANGYITQPATVIQNPGAQPVQQVYSVSTTVQNGGQVVIPMNSPQQNVRPEWLSWTGAPILSHGKAVAVLIMDFFLGPLGVAISACMDDTGFNWKVLVIAAIQYFLNLLWGITLYYYYYIGLGAIWALVSGIIAFVYRTKE